MEPDGVIETLQVFENGGSSLLPTLEAGPIRALFGEGGKEGFHRRIIPAVGGPTHAHLNIQLTQGRLVAIAGKLRTAIGMMQQPCLWMPPGYSHSQRQRDEFAIFTGRHGPAHHHAREEIENHRQEQPGVDPFLEETQTGKLSQGRLIKNDEISGKERQ